MKSRKRGRSREVGGGGGVGMAKKWIFNQIQFVDD